MRSIFRLRRGLGLLTLLCFVTLQVAPASAALVGTEQLLQQPADDRARLTATFSRPEVQRQLIALGVDPGSAQQRVAAMTDAEIAELNTKLEQLPAGGSFLGAIVLIAVVLLVTDAIGVTDVYGQIGKNVRE